MFTLHPRLEADTLLLGNFPLCTCRLMDDMHYPWLILVPQVADIREIYELGGRDQQQLVRESSWLAQRMAQHFNADKMNIAAIGNMVPQLHIHHIARYQNDCAWPAPVWGKHPAEPYTDDTLALMRGKLEIAFAEPGKIGFAWS